MKRKLLSDKILCKLTKYILLSLDELFETDAPSEFNVGERYAYLECLEILSDWRRFAEYGLTDAEKKYPID